jgi:hypothetical protein
MKTFKDYVNGPPIDKWNMHKNIELKSPQKIQSLNVVESSTKNPNKKSLRPTNVKIATH